MRFACSFGVNVRYLGLVRAYLLGLLKKQKATTAVAASATAAERKFVSADAKIETADATRSSDGKRASNSHRAGDSELQAALARLPRREVVVTLTDMLLAEMCVRTIKTQLRKEMRKAKSREAGLTKVWQLLIAYASEPQCVSADISSFRF